MERVLKPGRSSSHGQNLGAAVEEKFESTCKNKGIRSKDKDKYGLPFGQPYVDQSCGSRPKEVIQLKSSAKDLKSCPANKMCSDDEIVKHMSNLPSFLQNVQKRSTIQDNALNFGVLDWNRLQKWKYSEHMLPLHHKKTLPSSDNTSSSSVPKSGEVLESQPSTHGVVDPVLLSSGKPISHEFRFRSLQNQSALSHSSHVKKDGNIALRNEEKYDKHMKLKENETWQAAHKLINPRKIDSYDSCTKRNVETCVKEDRRKTVMSEELGASSSFRNKNKLSFLSSDEINSRGAINETRLYEEVDLTSKYVPWDKEKMAQFGSNKDFPNRSFSEIQRESRKSFDGQFAPEDHCSNNFSGSAGIPHSCPMFSGATTTTHAKSPIEPPQSQSILRGKSRRHSFSTDSSSIQVQDESSKISNVKGSQPSTSRRFSFSFRRMNHSSSDKGSLTIPQLSYGNRSGRLMPEAALTKYEFERDKGNVSGRRKSSPLRRLLDPFMKHKGSRSTESVETPNERQPHHRKNKGSAIQALLQVTVKNGIPFFKLVNDNSKDMLTAVMKKSLSPTSSGKTNLRAIYSFYSVHEIKKKSINWMSQGSKNKNCSLGYKILGQMKISNNYNADSSVERECVLYGIDPGQGVEQNPDVLLGHEIAAVVAKDSIQKINGGELSDEITNSDDVIIILPGGVHGIPIKGEHSSLVSRWRSGGSCDCGGWDIGCKLCILTNDHRKISKTPSCPNMARVELYLQGTQSNVKPVLILEPLNNGLYSVDLDPLIPLLEAFAICVGIITRREFSDILDVRDLLETENCPEAVIGTGNKKKTEEVKYMSFPPLSPAGRI